jgi:branched-chain amino acid transport system ATP-binding protein
MSDALLQVDMVSKNFGGLAALSNISLRVEQESITSLIGPNGAGKTTLFNAITNLEPLDSGKVFFQGKRIDHLSSYMVAGKGIQRTFQLLQVFKELSVLENVALGMHARGNAGILASIFRLPSMRTEEVDIIDHSMNVIQLVGLEARTNAKASQLPYGEQKLVEIARALVSQPKLLLLDEPTNGLNPSETQKLTILLQKMREIGVTIFLVAHDMHLVMDISDQIVALNFGKVIAEGVPGEIAENQEVIKAYLGKEHVIARA